MTAQERITEWAELADKATEGPWVAQDFDDTPGDWGVAILGKAATVTGSHLTAYTMTLQDVPQTEADAAHIVASRTAVPATLTAVLEIPKANEDKPGDTHSQNLMSLGFNLALQAVEEALETALGGDAMTDREQDEAMYEGYADTQAMTRCEQPQPAPRNIPTSSRKDTIMNRLTTAIAAAAASLLFVAAGPALADDSTPPPAAETSAPATVRPAECPDAPAPCAGVDDEYIDTDAPRPDEVDANGRPYSCPPSPAPCAVEGYDDGTVPDAEVSAPDTTKAPAKDSASTTKAPAKDSASTTKAPATAERPQLPHTGN